MADEVTRNQDCQKIHAELNQIMQQRFNLMLAAVASWSALIAWSLKGLHSDALTGQIDSSSIELSYWISIAAIILLAVLFFWYTCLKRYARVLSTYLIAKEWSQWEQDWKAWRDKKLSYVGYELPHRVVFALLGVSTLLTPVVFQPASRLKTCSLGWSQIG